MNLWLDHKSDFVWAILAHDYYKQVNKCCALVCVLVTYAWIQVTIDCMDTTVTFIKCHVIILFSLLRIEISPIAEYVPFCFGFH